MEEEAQCRDNRHQEETDNLQHEDDSTKYHRDDKAVEEDECEHDEFCLRVNDDVCNLLIFYTNIRIIFELCKYSTIYFQ